MNSNITEAGALNRIHPTIRIVALRRITLACPSQWEGMTSDGRAILIHYKRTILSVSYIGYDPTDGHRFRLDEVFRIALTADDFVDDELYDDGFAEFPTVQSVLLKHGVISMPDDMNVPDDDDF